MLRKIISIPEGVYYRGRFRATVAWPKVTEKKGDSDLAAGEEVARGTGAPSEPFLQGTVSATAESRRLQGGPSGRVAWREFT